MVDRRCKLKRRKPQAKPRQDSAQCMEEANAKAHLNVAKHARVFFSMAVHGAQARVAQTTTHWYPIVCGLESFNLTNTHFPLSKGKIRYKGECKCKGHSLTISCSPSTPNWTFSMVRSGALECLKRRNTWLVDMMMRRKMHWTLPSDDEKCRRGGKFLSN